MTFGELASAQVKHLIIDLRANEGGLSVGNEIIAHLVEQDIPLQQAVKKVRYRRVAEALAPFLDTWDPSFKDWGEPASSNGDGAYRLDSAATDDTVIHPQAPHIGWMVSVLVGARNSSAIFEFAQLIRQQRRGRLIGQPTGGNQRGINGGAFFFLRLPHTGIEVDLPIIGVFPLQPQPNAGRMPDIAVPQSAKAIAAGRDVEFDAALGLRRIANPTSALPDG